MAERRKIQRIPERLDGKSCAVREFTADGQSVGRCWYGVGESCKCPRHGDVKGVQEHYIKTGELTDERKLNHG